MRTLREKHNIIKSKWMFSKIKWKLQLSVNKKQITNINQGSNFYLNKYKVTKLKLNRCKKLFLDMKEKRLI